MFKLPNITGKTDTEKIAQIIDYLLQLVRVLNQKMTSIEEKQINDGGEE